MAGKARRGSRDRSLHRLLAGLRAVNAGDFSVRLAAERRSAHGRDHRRLQQRHAEAGAPRRGDRAREHVGRARGQDARPRRDAGRRRPVDHGDGLGELSHHRSRTADVRSLARDQGGGRGRPVAEGGARDRGQAGAGRVLPHRIDRESNGRSAQRVRERSDARGARSGNGRRAGRPGERAGRRRHVEGSDRLGERDGVEPHESGAQHRRRDDGGGQRRPVAEDHGRSEGRSARAQEHDQHHGRPALGLCIGSDARGARSGNGRRARRPGERAGRRRNVEGSY